MMIKFCILKNQKGLSTHGLPKRSPTLVLSMPQAAQLRSSDGIRCIWLSMADSDNWCPYSLKSSGSPPRPSSRSPDLVIFYAFFSLIFYLIIFYIGLGCLGCVQLSQVLTAQIQIMNLPNIKSQSKSTYRSNTQGNTPYPKFLMQVLQEFRHELTNLQELLLRLRTATNKPFDKINLFDSSEHLDIGICEAGFQSHEDESEVSKMILLCEQDINSLIELLLMHSRNELQQNVASRSVDSSSVQMLSEKSARNQSWLKKRGRRGPYKKFTPEEKEYMKRRVHEGTTIAQLAKQTGVSRNNLLRWIRSGAERRPVISRGKIDEQMEEDLLVILRNKKNEEGVNPSTREIRELAMELSRVKEFKASSGWLRRFMNRNAQLFMNNPPLVNLQ